MDSTSLFDFDDHDTNSKNKKDHGKDGDEEVEAVPSSSPSATTAGGTTSPSNAATSNTSSDDDELDTGEGT